MIYLGDHRTIAFQCSIPKATFIESLICYVVVAVFHLVEFSKKQDPHLLVTGIYDASFGVYNNMLIHMSPDAYVTAIAMGRSVGIFNTENGNLEELLEDVHGGKRNGDNLESLNKFIYLFINILYTEIPVQHSWFKWRSVQKKTNK